VSAFAPDGLGEAYDRNANMPAAYVFASWPRTSACGIPLWFHDDFRQVAYPFLYPLFDELVYISHQRP
jgi:hypothetical protein